MHSALLCGLCVECGVQNRARNAQRSKGAVESQGCNTGGHGWRRTAKSKSKAAKILSSELIFRGRVFALKRDRLVEPSGITVTREIVAHPGSAVVLPVFPDGRILLIRQYRHAAGEYLWELVAGHKEPNETFAEGAKRELIEETGYTAKRVRRSFSRSSLLRACSASAWRFFSRPA